ncbi:hypothetical protein FO519_008544 [Halicephalobus sp. NKZ332]|nr:hypothetical protein FO519_008544 [Halicephalobus sp. NKZ332]
MNNVFKFVILGAILYHSAFCIPLNLSKSNVDKVKEVLETSPKASSKCDICILLVSGLQLMIQQNKTLQELQKFASDTCVNFKLEQPVVCEAFSNNLGSTFSFVLQNTVFEPHQFCGLYFSNCAQGGNTLDKPWSIQIPGNKPPMKPWPIPESGKPTMRVLHLADIHVDRQYIIGSEADCRGVDGMTAYVFCCRNYSSQKDIKLPSGQFGTPMNCDIPFGTFEEAMKQEYDTRGPQWLYTVLNEQWGHWLPDTVKETIQYRGSYSFRPFKGLKMISLNTVYCSHWNL